MLKCETDWVLCFEHKADGTLFTFQRLDLPRHTPKGEIEEVFTSRQAWAVLTLRFKDSGKWSEAGSNGEWYLGTKIHWILFRCPDGRLQSLETVIQVLPQERGYTIESCSDPSQGRNIATGKIRQARKRMWKTANSGEIIFHRRPLIDKALESTKVLRSTLMYSASSESITLILC